MKYGELYIVFLIASLILVESGYSQHTMLQEEQDFLFAAQLVEKNMNDLAAMQFLKYARDYAQSPRAPEAIFRAGESYEALGNAQKAADTYLSLLMRYPQSSFVDKALYNRSKILSEFGEHMEAGLAFERIRLFMPESELAPIALANGCKEFILANDYKRALDVALFFLEEYPLHPQRHRVRHQLARIHRKQNKYNLALTQLDRILGERIEDDLKVSAKLLKADIFYELGRYSLADTLLYTLLAGNSTHDSIGAAALSLAKSLRKRGNYNRSLEVIANANDRVHNPILHGELLIVKGDNHYALNEFQQALESFARVEQKSLNTAQQMGLDFRKGYALARLKRDSEAVVHLKRVSAQSDTSDTSAFLQTRALLLATRLLALNSKIQEAMRLILDYKDREPYRKHADALYLHLAELQETFSNNPAAARRTYGIIQDWYPTSHYLDDAIMGIARVYEKEDKIDDAIQAYQSYLAQFPGGDHFTEAEKRIDYLNKFSTASSDAASQAFNAILSASLADGVEAKVIYDWALQQIKVFKDYQSGIQFLEKVEKAPERNLSEQDRLYWLGLCHARLAEKYFYDENTELCKTHLERLGHVLEKIAAGYKKDNKYFALKKDHILIQLQSKKRLQDRLMFLSNIVGGEAGSDLPDSLLFRFSCMLVENLVYHDSTTNKELLSNANRIGKMVAANVSDRRLASRGQFLQGLIYEKLAYPDSAQGAYEIYADDYGEQPRIPAAMMRLGQLYEAQSEKDRALAMYSELIDKFPYTSAAKKAGLKRCSILMQMERYDESKACVTKYLELQYEQEYSIYINDSKNEEALWLYSQIEMKNGNVLNAIAILKDYLLVSLNDRFRAQALFQLGELFLQLQNEEIALGHFEELIDRLPEDSLAEWAKLRRAELLFRKEAYDRAMDIFAALKITNNPEVAKAAAEKEVICAFRAGRIEKASRLSDQFKKTYGDRQAMASFLREEGDYYVKEMDFKKAEKCYKDLISDFNDLPEGSQGEMELARMYVILNRTDDALKILTDIPAKYNDPKLVASAYLNLADFYYENRQLENCIFAGRKALDLNVTGRERQQILQLMIRAYDDVRLWDRAISLLREYIDTNSEASDIFSRRVQLGIFLIHLKEYERGIAHLKDLKPLADAETEAEIQYWIAKAYLEQGKLRESITEFLKVKYQCRPAKLPWGTTALYEAGQVYVRLGELNKAKSLFQQIVREMGTSDQFGRVAGERIKEIDELLAKKARS